MNSESQSLIAIIWLQITNIKRWNRTNSTLEIIKRIIKSILTWLRSKLDTSFGQSAYDYHSGTGHQPPNIMN